jgi:outer membrane immunogenic protein
MNKLIAGSVALAAASFGTAALAADMPLKAPPPVVVYNWTGCYLGLSIGTNYGRSSGYETTAATQRPNSPTTLGLVGAVGPVTDSLGLSGMIGGAYGGCNYQVGAVVFGVEGDWSVTNKEDQAFNVSINAPNAGVGLVVPPATAIYSLKERWLGTARLRVGYAVTEKWLWYVTGGAAWAKLDSSQWLVANPVGTTALQSDWRGGWTVGVGTEYAVGYGWSIRSEFLYVDFGRYTTFTNVQPPFVSGFGPLTNLSVNLHDYIWRVGMSYKFGWTPAVVAKY